MKTRDELMIEEAWSQVGGNYGACIRMGEKVLELERSNWQPPVDPDLIEAREYLATEYKKDGAHEYAAKAMRGEDDDNWELKAYLSGLKRGRDLAGAGK